MTPVNQDAPAGIDAVILAGGRGSRLRGVIGDQQKVAFSIDGRTTLERLLTYLEESKRIGRVVVCAGFDAARVREVVADWSGALSVQVVAEESPLGTGGALRAALDMIRGDRFVVLNGDSFFPVALSALLRLHEVREASITLSAARVPDAERFGRVVFADDGSVAGFVEKGDGAAGEAWINGGVYLVEREAIAALPAGEVRSLEHDVLTKLAGHTLWGLKWPGPFIDIGTPESLATASDFFRHGEEQAKPEASNALVVLDRDGTLIEERHYLSDPDSVVLIEGAAQAVRILRELPVIVTVMSNQAGVGRGYFPESAVTAVNARMIELLEMEGAMLDAVYYCPHAPDAGCTCRKPGTGMIERALDELAINPRQFFVIGDKNCDVELARAVGGYGILVATGHGAPAQRDLTAPASFLVRDVLEGARLVEMLVQQDAWQRTLDAAGAASSYSPKIGFPC